MNNILDYTLEELQEWMKENKESAFRAKQVFSWIYKECFQFDEMKNIPKGLKEKLKEIYSKVQEEKKNINDEEREIINRLYFNDETIRSVAETKKYPIQLS